MVCVDNVLLPIIFPPIKNNVYIKLTDIDNRIRDIETKFATADNTPNEYIDWINKNQSSRVFTGTVKTREDYI